MTIQHIQKIKGLIDDVIDKVEGAEAAQVKQSYENSIQYIRHKKDHPNDDEPSFADFAL